LGCPCSSWGGFLKGLECQFSGKNNHIISLHLER
jgi:hypothetical protein